MFSSFGVDKYVFCLVVVKFRLASMQFLKLLALIVEMVSALTA